MNVVLCIIQKAGAGTYLILACLMVALLGIQPPASAMSGQLPADWVRLSADGKFELMAPPGSAYVPLRGIDSFVGRIKTPRFMLAFDYGAYSDPLKPRNGYQQYRVRDVQIDGKRARIVTAFAPGLRADRPYFIGVHFSNVKRSVVGSVKLTMSGSVAMPQDYKAIEALFGTIEFK